MAIRSPLLVPGLLFLSAVLGAPTAARADGNQALALTYHRIKTGLGVASTGVGLAGRRPGFPPEPLTTAELELEGVPTGATIERAYLYWATFGEPDAELSFEGNATTGTLIGSSANTCWGELPHFDYTTALNRVYRADVTSRVAGNDSYTLTGFPSASATGDSQGASLVVVYTDDTEMQRGEVSIYDGAVTMDNDTGFEYTMNAPAQGDSTQIELHFGAGDGQATFVEGLLKIGGKEIPTPALFQHYRETSGTYWDALVYDLTEIVSGTNSIQFFQEPGQDCILLAYQALFVRSVAVNGGEGGAGGAGGEPAGGASTGAGGASTGAGGASTGAGGEATGAGGESVGGELAGAGGEATNGGTATNGGRGSGKAGSSSGAGDGNEGGDGGDDSASERDVGGCGCRLSPALPAHASVAAFALALALGSLRRRAKRS